MQAVKCLFLFILCNFQIISVVAISSDIINDFYFSIYDFKGESSQNISLYKLIDEKSENALDSIEMNQIISMDKSLKSHKSNSIPLLSIKQRNKKLNDDYMIEKDYKMHDDSSAHSVKFLENDHDPNRVKKIHESLNEILPNDLCKMIGVYEKPTSLEYLHDTVIGKLDPLGKRREELNFENANFLKNLDLIVKEKEKEIPDYNIFWMDLSGLAIKVILHLKQKMINASSDDEYDRITNDSQSINSIIRKKSLIVVSNNFNLKTMKINHFNHVFLSIEFFEHSNHLSGKFIKALEYTYLFPPSHSAIDKEKGEIPDFDCNEFKLKMFENGNLDTDMLLTLFMIRYDKGRIIRDCLESNIQSSYPIKITKELIKEINYNIKGLKSRGIRHFFHIAYMKYANSSTMKYILSNKMKIFIEDEDDFYWCFRRIQEVGLLNRGKVESIVKFEKSSKSILNRFEEHLMEYGKFSFNSIEESNLVDEYLKLFRLEPSKEESIE